MALKRGLAAVIVSQCVAACGTTPPETGVGPTIVNGGEITLPPNTLGYRRAGLLSTRTAINVGATGTLGEIECLLIVTSDADGVHRCSLSTTLRRNVDYWIYLRDPDRVQGIDYHDEFVVGTQKVERATQVCFPTGACYRAGMFRVIDNSGRVE